MKSLKILHLTIDSRYGGIYRFIELWSKLDKKINPNIHHSTFKYKNLEKTINIINQNLSNKRQKKGVYLIYDFFLNFVFYVCEGLKNDVIVLHSIYLVILTPLFRILNKDIYLISHDYNNPLALQVISHFLIKRKHIFVAPWLKNSFWRSNRDSKNICLPTNIRITKKLSLHNLKKRKLTDSYKLSLVYVGSLSSIKGLSDLIIFLNHIEENVLINVIGPVEERYLKRLEKINKKHKIIFHGGIYNEDKKKQIMSTSKFAIIPSRSEVFPFVYSEFLNEGLIPICNSINVFKELSSRRMHIYNNISKFIFCIKWCISLKDNEYVNYHKNLTFEFNQFITSNVNVDSLSKRIINEDF